MARSCFIDNNVEKKISDEYISDDLPYFGLLIGQRMEEKDYIYQALSTNHRLCYKTFVNNPNVLLNKIETKLTEHATSIDRLLLGGVDVLGFYIILNKLQNTNLVAALKSIIFSLFKNIEFPELKNNAKFGFILEVTTNRKFFGRYYDLTNKQYSVYNVDVLFSNHLASFVNLQSDFNFNNKTFTELLFDSQSDIQFITLLLDNIKTVCKKLLIHKVSINETIIKNMEELIEDQFNGNDILNISLIEDLTSSGVSQNFIRDYNFNSFFEGTIKCKAFVHKKCNIFHALKVLFEDALRSLHSRYKLLALGIDSSDEKIENDNIFYEFPIRIFASFDKIPFLFCDYLFREEKDNEANDEFVKLIGCQAININSKDEKFKNLDSEFQSECIANSFEENELTANIVEHRIFSSKFLNISIFFVVLCLALIYINLI